MARLSRLVRIGIGIVGGAMNAAMRSETIVVKFKTIEKNFTMIVVNCAGTGVSLDKIYATGPGAARSSRTAANWRTTGQSFKETKQNCNKINGSFTAIIVSLMHC
jgi:hypothetical protein